MTDWINLSLFQKIQIALWILSLIGIFIAWTTFRQNTKLKRAEWLRSLFEKFYESDHYKDIRSKIDGTTIQQDVSGNSQLEEKLVDYLNFFEFIASLWKLKQLKKNEVLMLFDYYLKNINRLDILKLYIRNYGFENLAAFLKEI